jgi:hypothetical protein
MRSCMAGDTVLFYVSPEQGCQVKSDKLKVRPNVRDPRVLSKGGDSLMQRRNTTTQWADRLDNIYIYIA